MGLSTSLGRHLVSNALATWSEHRLPVRPICHTDYIQSKGQRMTNTERLRYLELIAIAKSDVMLASEFDELLGLQKKLGK